MSRVAGSVYFCKIFYDFGVNAFVTNFFPASTAALFPNSKAFFAPSLATLLPTSRAEDAICLAALLIKILIKKSAMVSKIPEPPYTYLFFKSVFSDYHFFFFIIIESIFYKPSYLKCLVFLICRIYSPARS